jgi:hypothetical protein
MRLTTKPAALVAVVLLVLTVLTGCGGDSGRDSSAADGAGQAGQGPGDGPPTNGSVEDFCATFVDMIQQASQSGGAISDAEAIRLAKQTAAKLAEIGTPEDIPADARQAFELAIERIQSIPDDATRQQMNEIADDFTAEQQKNLDSLTTYVTNKCISLPSGLPSS